MRRKWCWIVKRRNRHVDSVRIFGVLEKQVRTATCSKTADPIRMRDFPRLTFCYDEIFARHRSPGDIGRTGASPAINAMTIDQSKRPTLQHVSCPAANASATQFHTVRLPHFNHESTRMNTNSCSRRSPTAASLCGQGSSRRGDLVTATSRRDLENSEYRIAVCRAARSELYSLSSLDEFDRSSTS